MEASRFGFGSSLSPSFKFDPTDDNIVAHYLLPRALGDPNPPFAHAVIEADPASLPPPELLALHDHATSHHAFFLTNNGGRKDRDIKGGAGGKWRGQQGQNKTLTLLRPGGGAVDIEYKRYDLTYKRFGEEDEEEDAKGKKRKRKNGGTPSGWVMHEYTIVSPPLPNIVLSRINRKAGNIKQDQHHQVFTALEQPGPSYNQDYFPYQEQAGPSHRHEFPQQTGPSHHHDYPYLEQAGPSNHHDFPYQEQPGPSHHHDFPYQEQTWPSHHQDFPYQQQPGSGPSFYRNPFDVMSGGGGEGFSDGSQANDAFWYGDNVGGMGDGFLNMLRAAEEGFASDNTYCHQPIDMVCGGAQGFSDGSQADDASDNGGGIGAGTTPTTATTCTTMSSTCQVAATSSLADDQDKS